MAIDPYTHFKQVITALDDAGVDFLIVGGIALRFYGIERATKDIDLMILPQDAERAIQIFKRLGYRQFDPTMVFEEGRIVIERLTYVDVEEESFLKVDLLQPKGEPFLSIWSMRKAFDYEGRKIHVVSREGLMELKRLRGSELDLKDIEFLKETSDEENSLP